MAENVYIIPDRFMSEAESKFHVKKTSPLKIWIIAIVLSLVPIFALSLAYIVVLFLIYFVAIRLWAKIGQTIAKKTIVESIKSGCGQNSKMGLLATLLGIKFDKNKKYYIEAEVLDLDMGKSKLLFKRMFELVLTCVGFSFIIVQIIFLSFGVASADEAFNLVLAAVLIVGLMPIALFWMMPIIWTIDDLRIRGVDQSREMTSLGLALRRGLFGKILGTAGLLLAFDFLKTMITTYPGGFFASETTEIDSFMAIFGAIFYLIITLAIALGPAYLVGAFYLNNHHEKFVNTMRFEVTRFLPMGITSVRVASQEEVQTFWNSYSFNSK
jgi:hypothetical protein